MAPVTVVAYSEDGKLTSREGGGCSATYATLEGCPPCPLDSVCYAKMHRVGYTTRRLAERYRGKGPAALARMEATLITALPAIRPLRVHVSGDCRTPRAAELLAGAMVAYDRRGRRRGVSSWTYTQSWRTVARKAWQGARVLASTINLEETRRAWAAGWAVALTVPRFTRGPRAVDLGNGLRGVPCPADAGSLTCDRCGLCPDPARLRARRIVILFKGKHGAMNLLAKGEA